MVMYVDFMTCIFLVMYVMYPLRLLIYLYMHVLSFVGKVTSIS